MKEDHQEPAQSVQEMRIVHTNVIKASRMDNIDEICRFVARTIQALNQKSFIVVSLYDPEIDAVRIRAAAGFEKVMDRIKKIAGLDFTRLTFEPEKMEEVKNLFLTGRLEKIPGGLHTIMEKKIPKAVCKAAEKLMGIDNVYSIGFALEDRAYGGITILPPSGRELKFSSVIEALTSHFSLILHRRQSEQRLRESEEKHRRLFETMAQGVVYQDAEGEIISANPAAERILGFSLEEIQGRTSSDKRWHAIQEDETVFSGETHPAMQALTTGREVKNVVMGIWNNDKNDYRWININAVPEFRPGEKKPFRVFTTFDDITESRNIRKKLEESERLHKKAQRVAHIGHWELDPEVGTPIWSEEIFRIFGLDSSESEPSFTAHASHVHPEDWPLLNEAVTRGSRDGTAFDIEFRILQPGGDIKWMHALGTAEKDNEGKVAKLFGTAQDITKQKLAEQRVKQLESLLKAVRNVNQILVQEDDLLYMMEGACRALIEARTYSSCSIALMDEDEKKLQLLAQVGDRLFSREWSLSLPGLENTPDCIKKAVNSGEIVIMDTGECGGCELKNSDSAYKSVVVPMKKGKKVIGLLHLCMSQSRDIGKEEKDLLEEVAMDLAFGWEKHQTDKALQVTQLSVDMATTPIFWINPAGRFIYVNQAVCRHLGFSCEDMLNMDVGDIDPGYPMTQRKNFWQDLKENKKLTMETTHQRKNGTMVPVEVTTNYIEVAGEEYEFAFVTDITERKQAEEQIQRDLRIKETLLQEIHHRVKNNFNVISSLLNLQSQQINTKEDAVNAFKESRHRIHSMLLVHENLYRARDISRINMKEYIDTMIQDLMPSYTQDKKIRLDLSVKDIYLDINAAVPCGLIINEIITNALKHAFEGLGEGRIWISFRLTEKGLYELIVRDDGIGLPSQLNIHQTESLGLKLISLLVRQIDGTMNVAREDGARFRIVFPKIT